MPCLPNRFTALVVLRWECRENREGEERERRRRGSNRIAGDTTSKTAVASHPPLGLCRVLQNHEPSGRLQGFCGQSRAEAHLFTSDTWELHVRGNFSAGRPTRTGKSRRIGRKRGGDFFSLFEVPCSRALPAFLFIRDWCVCFAVCALCTGCSYKISCCKSRVGAESAGASEDKINSVSLRCSATSTLHDIQTNQLTL